MSDNTSLLLTSEMDGVDKRDRMVKRNWIDERGGQPGLNMTE